MSFSKTAIMGLILISGLASAYPVCGNFPYKDFTWSTDYSPPVRPIDSLLDRCDSLGLSDPQICIVIQTTNLSSQEKKQLILDDLARDSESPSFQQANSWNQGLQFGKYPPDGVDATNSANIKNAWIKITSINPSVLDLEQNQTDINDTGNIQIAQNFDFVITKENFPNDCRTFYQVCGYDYSVRTFNNGQELSTNNNQANFQIGNKSQNSINLFSTTLSVNSQYIIHHWMMVTHCNDDDPPYCITDCEYVGADDRSDSVRLTDNKTTEYYAFNTSSRNLIERFDNGLAEGWLSINATQTPSSVKFSIDNSFLSLRNSQFNLKNDLAPYNVLTPAFSGNPNTPQVQHLSILSRENNNLTSAGNYTELIHFLANAENLNCRLEINTPFEKQTFANNCQYDANSLPVINLTLTKSGNSSIKASGKFFDNYSQTALPAKKIIFAYGSENVTVKTDSKGLAETTFDYSPRVNLISAEFLTDFETKSAKTFAILLSDPPDFLNQALHWIGFVITIWLLFQFAKKWFK